MYLQKSPLHYSAILSTQITFHVTIEYVQFCNSFGKCIVQKYTAKQEHTYHVEAIYDLCL